MFQLSTIIIQLDASTHHSHTQIMKALWNIKSFYYTIPRLDKSLKLVSAICHFFTKSHPLNNYEKFFLFHLKNSFRSQDVQIFVFLSSLLFFLLAIGLEDDIR